jgi:SulP family sulfate permease
VISRAFPPVASALRETLREGYGAADLRHDLLAGLSVGIIAVPLALALAIASGVPPQHGLYTAVVAGALIALAGGSRYSVSGPTAAFVVILFPIAQQHGLGGLLLATFMAGLILVAMGWGRMGQLIQYIPYPVTTGFTAGIALVIASLQLKDLLGLTGVAGSEHFLERVGQVFWALPALNPVELVLGLATLLLMVAWRRLGAPLPPYLAGAVFAGIAAWGIKAYFPELALTTIADRFSYVAKDGAVHAGIPALLPEWHWPWDLPGKGGAPLSLSFELVRSLVGPAFAIAMLGAIESLLCAVVADGMTGRAHANGLASIDLDGPARLYLASTRGRWRLRAAQRGDWRIDYLEWPEQATFPARLQLTATTPLVVTLRAGLAQTEANVPIDNAAFSITVPPDADPITVEELRQAGPLREQSR